MIKSDVKSGVSVPAKSNPEIKKMTPILSPRRMPLEARGTFFPRISDRFKRARLTLVRTDWRDGPIQYYVVRHGSVSGPYGWSELVAMLWVIGDPK